MNSLLPTEKHPHNPCKHSDQALVNFQLLTSMKVSLGQLSLYLHPLSMQLKISLFCKCYFSYIKKSHLLSATYAWYSSRHSLLAIIMPGINPTVMTLMLRKALGTL